MIGKDDFKELDELISQAEVTSEEFISETRGGAGSPVERRMADAFSDLNKSYRKMSEIMNGIAEEQKAVRASLESIEGLSERMHSTVKRSAGQYMSDYGESLQALKAKTDEAVSALGSMDTRVAESYEEAVKKSTRKLTVATAASAGLLSLLSIVGGLLAFIGAFFVFQAFPAVKTFIESVGWWTVLLILAGVAAVIWFGYCIWARNK